MKRSILTLLVLLVLLVAIPAVAEVPDASGPEAASELAVLSHPAGTVHETAADAAQFSRLEAREASLKVANEAIATITETNDAVARRSTAQTRDVDARSRTVNDVGHAMSRYVLLC